MSLTLTPTQKSAASIINGLRGLASVYEHATRHIDGILDSITALPSDQLADLGNEIGETDLASLLAAHAAQSSGVNALATGIEAIVASIEAREPSAPRAASTLTLDERLAQQGREIVLTEGVYSVVALPEEYI